jgi:hypothetical protein
MRTKYFKTREQAIVLMAQYIDAMYPNKFQDARSISSLKLVEFQRGFAIQRGDYGPYLTTDNFAVSQAIASL